MKFLISIIISLTIISCTNTSEKTEDNNWKHNVVVDEVIQTSSYTYLLVKENDISYWLAVSRMNVKENDVLYYNSGLEMRDFVSKELNRTFDKLLLVQVISDGNQEVDNHAVQKKRPTNNTKSIQSGNKENMGVVSLSELFSNSADYNGKLITVSGKVVKVNPNIMGRNWVHIIGSESGHDLTITTSENVKINDDVTFEGVITLNKDFGAGYKYPIIMEEGIIK